MLERRANKHGVPMRLDELVFIILSFVTCFRDAPLFPYPLEAGGFEHPPVKGSTGRIPDLAYQVPARPDWLPRQGGMPEVVGS